MLMPDKLLDWGEESSLYMHMQQIVVTSLIKIINKGAANRVTIYQKGLSYVSVWVVVQF